MIFNQNEIKKNYPLAFKNMKKWFNENFFETFAGSPPGHKLGYLFMYFNHKRINLTLSTETSDLQSKSNEIKIKHCFKELETRLELGYKATPPKMKFIS